MFGVDHNDAIENAEGRQPPTMQEELLEGLPMAMNLFSGLP